MASLPVFHLRQNINAKDICCKHINITDLKKVNRREALMIFPKFKKLFVAEKFYALSNGSIEISKNAEYSVQITNDGCFDLVFQKFGVFYRIFTRGSIGILQVAKLSMLEQNRYKNVGKFIPSPLAIFVKANSEDVNEVCKEETEEYNIEEDIGMNAIDLCDEEEFDYMFSNKTEPFVGGFNDITPFLLQ